MILNSGEFYGMNPPTANLELVARFFEKYPAYADKAFLSVKGGVSGHGPDSSPENLKRSVDNILEKLRGTKKLDLFECARVDPNIPVADTIATLAGFVKEGKFSYIGMSECSAASLRAGNSAHPIAAVEIEVSPWSYTDQTRAVIDTAKELGITVVAYSPLGRGFLTGKIKPNDLHPNDLRKRLTRFKDENLEANTKIVDALTSIASKKGITAAQLCIAWVSSLGEHVVPLPGSSNKKRTIENLAGGDIDLTADELADIKKTLAENPVVGDRYWGSSDKEAHLWG